MLSSKKIETMISKAFPDRAQRFLLGPKGQSLQGALKTPRGRKYGIQQIDFSKGARDGVQNGNC